MQDLKLIPAREHRSSGKWPDDDYDVVLVDAGQTIGRIFRNTVSTLNPTPWFWGIDSFKAGKRRPYYGQVESKEAAKAAFAECWRRPEAER